MEKLTMLYTNEPVYRASDVHDFLQDLRDDIAHQSSLQENWTEWPDVFAKIDAVLGMGKLSGEVRK